jgi:hypothetical protein
MKMPSSCSPHQSGLFFYHGLALAFVCSVWVGTGTADELDLPEGDLPTGENMTPEEARDDA